MANIVVHVVMNHEPVLAEHDITANFSCNKKLLGLKSKMRIFYYNKIRTLLIKTLTSMMKKGTPMPYVQPFFIRTSTI